MQFQRCKQSFALVFIALLAVSGLYAQVDPTSIEGAQAAVLAGSIAQVAFLNADRVTRCDGAIDNFNLNNQSGQDNVNKVPPLAPFKWELAPPNQDGFVFYQLSTTQRVTCTHVLNLFNAFDASKVVKPANFIDVGVEMVSMPGWFVVGQNDTFPSGQTTPPMPPDGRRYLKWGTAVGRGWYQRVN
jgi:hypothetical protein